MSSQNQELYYSLDGQVLYPLSQSPADLKPALIVPGLAKADVVAQIWGKYEGENQFAFERNA